MASIQETLLSHPFLKGLNPKTLSMIVANAEELTVDTDEMIFNLGERANHCFLLTHGKVAVELYAGARGPITLQTLGPGDVLGWSWLIKPHQWHFSARAVELTRAVQLDGAVLRKKCKQNPELSSIIWRRIARIMEERVRATRMQLMDIYSK